MDKKKFLIGQLLLEQNIITQEQLDTALGMQKETGEKLGIILLRLGFVDEEKIFLPILAQQQNVDYVNIKNAAISTEVLKIFPAKFAIHYKVMPIELKGDVLTIATSSPADLQVLDEIGIAVHGKLNPVLASEKDILDAIRKYYGVGAETIDEMMGSVQTFDAASEVDNLEDVESEASISKFLNQIFLEAYRDRATDIHIEPFENELKIRYRVDGILYDAKVPQDIKHFKDSICSRIKILSNLNIAEKRLPQDGRFKLRVGDFDLDIRVSFMPTPFGESVVLRVLHTTRLFRLSELGLTTQEDSIIKDLIQKPNGIIFLTGPTGSGKTTTLYSCLSEINTEDKKIITIEDPIEYQLNGIIQIQVNPFIGLTFAKGLRSMLRHDPDIMMIGEVRDIETAEVAIQIALTGHLVFSTLHTNDAASGITRLLDMGIQPFLITSTIKSFIAQRLVRTLCTKCKQPSKTNKETIINEDLNDESFMIFEGKGCEECNFTGYLGRTSIFEILLVNEEIRNLIMERATADTIKETAVRLGMKTLSMSGWEKVKQGITTPQEVIRVTQEED